jgi:hypothetical protein
MHSISSLIFLIPFLITAIIFWSDKIEPPVSQIWLWISSYLGILVAIFTGRKAVWLILMITPLFIFLFWILAGEKIRSVAKEFLKFKILGFLVLILSVFLTLTFFSCLEKNFSSAFHGFDVISIKNSFKSGFEFGHDEIATLRSEQFLELIKAWWESPLIGHGLGASLDNFVRSKEQPWAYELSYAALLFHTGLIGLIIYFSGVIWIFYKAFKICQSEKLLAFYIAPVMVGMACFLVANGTNPYLEKFDFMWIIFLPIMLINNDLLKNC